MFGCLYIQSGRYNLSHTSLPCEYFGNVFSHERLYFFHISFTRNECLRYIHRIDVLIILETFLKDTKSFKYTVNFLLKTEKFQV